MDKGNKDILFQNILFEISFLVLYIRVIRKKDNTSNVMYIQILMRLQCYFISTIYMFSVTPGVASRV